MMFAIFLFGAAGACLAVGMTALGIAHAIPASNDDLIYF